MTNEIRPPINTQQMTRGKGSESVAVPSSSVPSNAVYIGHGCGFAVGFPGDTSIAQLFVSLATEADGTYYEAGVIEAVAGGAVLGPELAHFFSWAKFYSNDAGTVEVAKAS